MSTDPRIDAYERETRPTPARVERLAAASVRRHLSSTRPSRALLFAAALAGAAVALLGVLAARSVGNAPGLTTQAASTPAELRPSVADPEPLAAADRLATRTLPSGVALTWQGAGEVAGDDVTWEAGALQVEVPPGRGITFSVHTREATIQVIGTGFTVTRGALGTDVDVAHGYVAVRCGDDAPVLLAAGERRTCAPVSAAGLLARARALDASGADASQVLAAVDAGLARAAPGDAIAGELRYFRAEVRYRAGDRDGASRDLEAWLAEPGDDARRDDARRLAAALALDAHDCAAARPLLEALATGEPTADDLVRLGECEDDPAAAREAFLRALARDPDGAVAPRARAGLARLGP